MPPSEMDVDGSGSSSVNPSPGGSSNQSSSSSSNTSSSSATSATPVVAVSKPSSRPSRALLPLTPPTVVPTSTIPNSGPTNTMPSPGPTSTIGPASIAPAVRFFFLHNYLDMPVPDGFYMQPRSRFRLLSLEGFRPLKPPPADDSAAESEVPVRASTDSTKTPIPDRSDPLNEDEGKTSTSRYQRRQPPKQRRESTSGAHESSPTASTTLTPTTTTTTTTAAATTTTTTTSANAVTALALSSSGLPRPAGAVPDYVIVVSSDDADLTQLKQSALRRLETVRSRRFHARVMELVTIVRSRLTHHHADSLFWADIAELTTRAQSVVVPLGWLRSGLADEASLLFKILCDACNVECRMVRGRGSNDRDHAWNFVREEGLPERWHLVDVLLNAKHPCPSEATQSYTIERGRGNGNPIDGERPFDPHEPKPSSDRDAFAVVCEAPSTVVRTGGVAVVCPCADMEEFGLMVQCLECAGWSHAVCLRMDRHTASSVEYRCWLCRGKEDSETWVAICNHPRHTHTVTLHAKLLAEREERLRLEAEYQQLQHQLLASGGGSGHDEHTAASGHGRLGSSAGLDGKATSSTSASHVLHQHQHHHHHHHHHYYHHHHHHTLNAVNSSKASVSKSSSNSGGGGGGTGNTTPSKSTVFTVSSNPESPFKLRLVLKSTSSSTVGNGPSSRSTGSSGGGGSGLSRRVSSSGSLGKVVFVDADDGTLSRSPTPTSTPTGTPTRPPHPPASRERIAIPPRPAFSAFSLFTRTVRRQLYAARMQADTVRMLHVASQRWRNMSPTEKLGFELLAEADMDRYDKEWATYIELRKQNAAVNLQRSQSLAGLSAGSRSVHRTASSSSPTGSPRTSSSHEGTSAAGRHISAFNLLAAVVRKELQARSLSPTLGDISRATADRWHAMTDEDRQNLLNQVNVRDDSDKGVLKRKSSSSALQFSSNTSLAPAFGRTKSGTPPPGSPSSDNSPSSPSNQIPSSPFSIKKRRRISCTADYDIDNIIVPVAMAPAVIEAVRVKEVYTPTWRLSSEDGSAGPSSLLTSPNPTSRGSYFLPELSQSGSISGPTLPTPKVPIKSERVPSDSVVSTVSTESISNEDGIDEDDSDTKYEQLHLPFERAERARLPIPVINRRPSAPKLSSP